MEVKCLFYCRLVIVAPGRNVLEGLAGFAETEEEAWGQSVHLPLPLCQHYQLPVSDDLSCSMSLYSFCDDINQP